MFAKKPPKRNKFRTPKNAPKSDAKRPVVRRRLDKQRRQFAIAKKIVTHLFMPAALIGVVVMSNLTPADYLSKANVSAKNAKKNSISIGSLQEKASFGAGKVVVETAEAQKEIPTLRARKKLNASDIQARQKVDDIKVSFIKSLDNGIPQDLIDVEEAFGFSRNVLLTFVSLESAMGTHRLAKGNPYQTLDDTHLEYFTKYGKKFVEKASINRPELAKEVSKLLPYLKRNHNAKKGQAKFSFEDSRYLAKHKKYPVINGHRMKSIKDWAKSYKGHKYLTPAFAALKSMDEEMRTANRFLNEGNLKALRQFNNFGPAKYYLMYYRGGGKIRRSLLDSSMTGKKIIEKSDERKGYGITDNMSNIDSLNKIVDRFDAHYNEIAVLNSLYKVTANLGRGHKFASMFSKSGPSPN